MLPILLQNE